MGAALPAIADAAASALLLLLAAGLWLLAELLQGTLGHVPGVGGWISSHVTGEIYLARDAILHRAASTWGGLVKLINWASDYLFGMFARVVLAVQAAAAAADRLATVTIPREIASVSAAVSRETAAVAATAGTLFTRAERDIAAAAAASRAYIASLYDQAIAYTASAVAVARSDASRAVATAEQAASQDLATADTMLLSAIATAGNTAAAGLESLTVSVQAAVNTLAADITTSAQHAETLAAENLTSAVAGIYTDLETWGNQAVTRAWPDATGDLEALRQAAGQDFPWVSDILKALAGAGTAGLAGALIRSLGGVRAITESMTRCVLPNCRNLSPLGHDLAELGSPLSTAAMLAWLAFIAADPVQAADDTTKVAAPLLDTVFGPLTALISAGAQHL